MRFSIEGLKHFENMMHPHLISLKRHYLKNRMYVFPIYGKKKQKEKLKINFIIQDICQILI